MDNEKKTTPDGSNNKNRHKRHKGYFINPNQKNDTADKNVKVDTNGAQKPVAQQKPQQPKPQQKPQAPQKENASAQGNNNNANNNGSRNNSGSQNRSRNHKKRNKPHVEKSAETVVLPKIENEANKSSNTEHSEAPHKKNHKNKPKRPSQFNDTKLSSQLLGSIDDAPKKKEYPAPIIETAENLDPKDIPDYVLDTPASITLPKNIDTDGKTEVVGIRFKSSGKVYYFDPCGKKYSRATHAIVETARGQEYGEVALGNTWVAPEDVVSPLRPVVRAATQDDEAHHLENSKKEDEAFKICNEKIAAHKLDMKLIDAQYTFDNSKLLFYFTSAGRVDFRDLVKDLASVFRTRIELRQIGIRDEARLMGGLGLCGRPLCCSLFLTDFGQVSIKMAKEQNLSLNSAKISGICGRLMCCLRYEHDTYDYEIKRTPPIDSLVETPDGNGVVVETAPLTGKIKVRLSATPEIPPKHYHRDDVKVIQKKAPKPEDNK